MRCEEDGVGVLDMICGCESRPAYAVGASRSMEPTTCSFSVEQCDNEPATSTFECATCQWGDSGGQMTSKVSIFNDAYAAHQQHTIAAAEGSSSRSASNRLPRSSIPCARTAPSVAPAARQPGTPTKSHPTPNPHLTPPHPCVGLLSAAT